ncbi:MAG: hypothetical protein ABJH98_04150 [Reichenbachiella sp.]|uniref:hypothetical protein n=1 Tax=Reichenbachiella sp. TaxID=2184521 RepID=UPI0032981F64
MTPIAEELVGKIDKCLKKHFQTRITELLESEIDDMLLIVEQVNSYYALSLKKRSSDAQLAKFKSELLDRIEPLWPKPESNDLAVLHESFLHDLQGILEEVPIYRTIAQSRERFFVVDHDQTWVKIFKIVKRLGYFLTSLPNDLANLFRKEKEEKPYWKHEIPLRNLAKKHFFAQLILDLQEISGLYYSELAKQYYDLKEWEEKLNQGASDAPKHTSEDILNFKSELIQSLKKKIKGITRPNAEKFELEYEKAGTFELPEARLSQEITTKKIESAKSHWSLNDLEWRNTNYALFEEWRMDLNIHLLKHKTLASLHEFQSAQFKKIDDYIGPEMDEIKSFIDESIGSLSKEHESIAKELKRLNYQAVKKLDKEVVPRLCDKLSNQTIINLINRMEVKIANQVAELSDERVIVKSGSYGAPIKSTELNVISPHELIAFETLPAFKKQVELIKQSSFSSLEKMVENVKDLDHIITFSLSSGIASMDQQRDPQEAISIAEEGLKRAATRLIEERNQLNEAMVINGNELETAINTFCDGVMELTFNENVSQLRLRITKAKATQQAKEVRQKLEEKMTTRKKRIVLFALAGYNDLRHGLSRLSENFVLTAKKPEISKQVSDFLLESRQAIDKLPLIYKRLYQIEPLEDLELFEGRKDELNTLKKAFDSWQKGHYAATVVLGEKWSGLTSFLTYSLHQGQFPFTITRMKMVDNGCNEDHFMQLMRSAFKEDSFESLDDVINYLNSSSKRVVILEDIQNLFQRKVHGFEAMQLLFQLVNKTYKNVFWVTSTTVYTWSYLQKTININEYFSYVIELKTLSSEQIINIIWKRNRISGFKIQFETDASSADDKKFKKLNEAEQQQWLKKKFFSELNSFAQSNISLALIYWLLSTKEVDDSTITVGTFKKPNLNFLTVLAMDKIYALHALVLHDGLTIEQLAQILNVTVKNCELTLLALLEDGILVKTDENYMVNPIVYRNTISLLKSRNLIH